MSAYFVLAVLISAGITYALRALPFFLFRGRKEMPKWLAQLGGTLPSAIMAVLIVYCLRHVKGDLVGTGLPAAAAVLIVAASYKWKHKTFLSIILGTGVYMLLLRVVCI